MRTTTLQQDREARIRHIQRLAVTVANPLARRYRLSREDAQDMEAHAVVWAIERLDRFDPAKGGFATYMIHTLRGACQRWRREQVTTTTPLSRKRYEAISKEMNVGEFKPLSTLLKAWEKDAISLDAPLKDDDDSLIETVVPDANATRAAQKLEAQLVAQRELERLDDRLARVIRLRYWDGLSQKDVSEIIGVSQMHVSRLERKALATMRERCLAP